jgi:amino-acid N-acetyltransferase
MKFSLRPATSSDQAKIRALIRQVRINPTQLDWRNFVIAVAPSGEMLGCGQVKSHRDGSRELASIAVVSEYRNQGIARAIIEHLINVHPKPLFLTCRAELGSFYPKWGFRVVEKNEMPPYFRRIHRLANMLMRLSRDDEGLLVMKLQAQG